MMRVLLAFAAIAAAHAATNIPTSEYNVLKAVYAVTNHHQGCNQGWNGRSGDACKWHDDTTQIVKCENGHVTSLYVYECGFLGPIPENIGNLTELTWLTFANPKATTLGKGGIPDSIGNLHKLQHLQITDCSIGGTLPDTLGDIGESLVDLSLDRGHFTGTLPASIGKLTNLTRLTVQNNDLTGTIPDSFTQLKNLQTFDTKFNRLTGAIPKMAFGGMTFCSVGGCSSKNSPFEPDCNNWACPLPFKKGGPNDPGTCQGVCVAS